MKKLIFICIIISSCAGSNNQEIDHDHVEALAKNFMQTTVIPKMKDPKPFEIVEGKVVIKRAADVIKDYKFIYNHLSSNEFDSMHNKRYLDSLIAGTRNPDSVISVTINVAYKTKYRLGDIVTDSIKLAYDHQNYKVTYWPF